MSDYLEQLRATPAFRQILDMLVAERPIVPAYRFNMKDGTDNTEEWKALSNQQKGFDKCLVLLGEEINE